MAKSNFIGVDEDRLNEDEVRKLADLAVDGFAPADFPDGAVSIQDVAEASGRSVSSIREQLRSIRAETALGARPAQASATPWLIGAGFAALAIGVAVMIQYRRGEEALLQPMRPGTYPRPVLMGSPTPTTTVYSREPPPSLTPSAYGIQNGPGTPPPGLTVCVVGRVSQVQGNSYTPGRVQPMSYAQESEWLADSIAATAAQAVVHDSQSSSPLQGSVRDGNGSEFTPRPGQLHFSVSGWPGLVSGWLSLPLGPGTRPSLLRDAHKLLENVNQAQEQGLDTSVDPGSGVVLPPPGYSLDLYGRRADHQKGARISFAPINPAQAAKRFELAVENAILRDGRPPLGRWTSDAAVDAKIPWPENSRVQVTGPDGVEWGFDVPTANGWNSASRRATQAAAERVKSDITSLNSKAADAAAKRR